METITREVFRITISKVSKIDREETEENFVKSGEIIDWLAHNALSVEEQKGYTKIQKPTGKIEKDESRERLYEQDFEALDIKDLAVYLNRVK